MVLMLVPGADRLLRSSVPVPGLGRLRRSVAEFAAIGTEAAASDAPLVRALRDAVDQDARLSPEDLRDELLTLLLAGHETTATTLTWAWWFLDRHPELARRVRAEHEAVLAERLPSYDDLEALPLTTAVVAETLRLRPPAWILEREVVGDLDLAGLRPPRRTVLAISPWLLHRDPAVWPDPDAFRPERWLTAAGRYDQNAPGHPRGSYLPFGAGSHVCVGASFAWAEAVLVLATLVRRWCPVSVVGDPGTRALATVRPAVPLRMRLVGTRQAQGELSGSVR
jgi:cytochrome P450